MAYNRVPTYPFSIVKNQLIVKEGLIVKKINIKNMRFVLWTNENGIITIESFDEYDSPEMIFVFDYGMTSMSFDYRGKIRFDSCDNRIFPTDLWYHKTIELLGNKVENHYPAAYDLRLFKKHLWWTLTQKSFSRKKYRDIRIKFTPRKFMEFSKFSFKFISRHIHKVSGPNESIKLEYMDYHFIFDLPPLGNTYLYFNDRSFKMIDLHYKETGFNLTINEDKLIIKTVNYGVPNNYKNSYKYNTKEKSKAFEFKIYPGDYLYLIKKILATYDHIERKIYTIEVKNGHLYNTFGPVEIEPEDIESNLCKQYRVRKMIKKNTFID